MNAKYIYDILSKKSISFLRLLNIAISTIFVVYLISNLDVKSFGDYSFYITIVKFLPYLLCLNIPEYLFKSIPKAKSTEKIDEYLKVQFPFFLYSITFFIFNLGLFKFDIYNSEFYWVINVCILSINLRLYNSFLIFDGKILKFSVVDLFVNCFWIFNLLLIDFNVEVIFELRFFYGLFFLLLFYLTEISFFEKTKNLFSREYFLGNIKLPFDVIKFGIFTLPSILLIMSMEVVDRWLLTIFSGSQSLGYLGFTMMPANIIFGFISMVYVSARLKDISANSRLSHDEKYVCVPQFKKEIIQTLSITLVLSVTTYVLFYFVTISYFYEKYSPVVNSFWINPFISTLMVSIYYLRFCLINHFRKYVNWVYLIGLGFNVVINIVLIPYLGYLAALISSLFSLLLIFLLCLYRVKSYAK